jgi:hypothetical protein
MPGVSEIVFPRRDRVCDCGCHRDSLAGARCGRAADAAAARPNRWVGNADAGNARCPRRWRTGMSIHVGDRCFGRLPTAGLLGPGEARTIASDHIRAARRTMTTVCECRWITRPCERVIAQRRTNHVMNHGGMAEPADARGHQHGMDMAYKSEKD